jgi:hypothetical protein
MRAPVVFFGGRGERGGKRKGIFYFFLVPNVVPYWVPLKFPKVFPIAPQIYPI